MLDPATESPLAGLLSDVAGAAAVQAGAAAAPESEQPGGAPAVALDAKQIENLVRRSYQYVAMYNVNNKTTDDQIGGWNKTKGMTELLDHTVQVIARPNNDTLYITSMLDLRKEPVILDMPAFDSKYVSLLVSGYDHYVSIPLASRLGEFQKPGARGEIPHAPGGDDLDVGV